MQSKGDYLPLFLVVLALAGNMIFSSAAIAEEGCVTGQCHSTMLKTKNIHPVAQPCDTCHEAVLTPHPQKDKKTFKLVQEMPALCNTCHTPFGNKKVVHPPVKDGMCTSCHNPHDSEEAKLLSQPAKDLCLSCHPDKVNYKYVHGPASTGECTTCHSPHESDNKSLVLKPDICFLCHTDIQDDIKNKKAVHSAIDAGCTSCHNPHGGEVKKFLAAEGKDLCFRCHSQVAEKLKTAKVIHAPIATDQSCASCHAPHASDNEKLVLKPGKELCLDCHKGFLKKNWTVLHGPIRDGKCLPCHDPHGTENRKLLAKEFPVDFYVPYNDKEYELCFSCHNRDLLRFPDTSFATGFRDGERNLHFLHVNREKGRNCMACHSIHGGTLTKLIGDKVPFGKWDLPLKFEKTDNGGSCAPGCHQKFNYDRKSGKEFKKPAEVKKKGK